MAGINPYPTYTGGTPGGAGVGGNGGGLTPSTLPIYGSAGQNYSPVNPPNGYTYDPVQRGFVPTVGSAGNQSMLQNRALGMGNTFYGQEQQAFQGLMDSMNKPTGIPAMSTAFAATPMPAMASGSASGTASMPAMTPVGSQNVDIQFPTAAIQAGQQAAYNQAKDTQGQTNAAALNALRSQLAGRGMLGGGIEAQGTTGIVQQGAGALGNLTRQQAIDQGQQALQAAETAYQGGITQRGQNIGAQEAQNQQALQSWSANEAAREAANQQALQGWQAQNQFGLGAAQLGQQGALAAANLNLAQRQMQNQALMGLLGSNSRYYGI